MMKLSAKAYWRQFTPAPDFVVMFVPDETLLRVAHDHDPRLSEDAWAQHVIIASPSTLMSILRTVAAVWQQETIAESARQIWISGASSTSGSRPWEPTFRLGRSLDGAVKSYNETVGSLERTVLPQARRFEQHGITGIETPELAPIERQTRALAAPELVAEETPRSRCSPRTSTPRNPWNSAGLRAFSKVWMAITGEREEFRVRRSGMSESGT